MISNKPTLIIIRGLPGSGKSTLAKGMVGFNHYEADMYFIRNGEYIFDHNKINRAHEWCQERVKKSLEKGFNTVVSNTFVRLWEMEFYLNLKDIANVMVVECHNRFGSVHNIPDHVIERMRNRWEKCYV